MDPATVAVAITLAGQGLTEARTLLGQNKPKEALTRLEKLSTEFLTLSSSLTFLQQEKYELQTALNEAKNRISELEKSADLGHHLTVTSENCYHLAPEHGGKGHGLYCTNCFDDKKKLILLVPHGMDIQCPACKTIYQRTQRNRQIDVAPG